MDNKNISIKNIGNTCCNCLKETKIHNIRIRALGWGSSFDNFSTQIDLCDDCLKLTNPEWWKLKVCGNFDKDGQYDQNGEWYEFEDEIYKFVKQMPLAGQELFYNHYGCGACASYNMDAQDWIDYNLGTLSHKKCKKYGVYSPQEIQSYQEKFPTCQHPINKIYRDDSKGCWCPFGANGEYGQRVGLNISSSCYQCKYYIKRVSVIKEIKGEDWEDYKIYYISKIKKEEYKNKFE